ncbi:MAG: ammonium transporter [Rikenellaceae bacterium]
MLTTINSGNTTFMMIATLLVFIMTPGLALFYGGLVERKNSLTMMFYSFIAIGVVTVMWYFGGFSLVFGDDLCGVIGNPTQYFMLRGVDFSVNSLYGATIPFLLFFIYQLMFAIIAAPLMTGAFANRMTPFGWIKLLVLWMLFIYFPVAHWVWGGGFLSQIGFVDYAGGTVIHATAGFSSLVAIMLLGRRKEIPTKGYGNINLVLIGTAILMLGWFGFNSGGALAANEVAAIAFVNSGIAAAFAMVVWSYISYRIRKRISFVELATGAIAGLATITPATGYVTPQGAAVIGVLAAMGCFCFVELLKRFNVDDALGVWGVHGMGGFLGTLYIALFAVEDVNMVSAGWQTLQVQFAGVAFVSIYSMAVTWAIMKLTGGAVPAEVQHQGLDEEYFDPNR